MSTYYKLSGSFDAKAGVTKQQIEKHCVNKDGYLVVSDDCITFEDDNGLRVDLGFGNSLSSPNDLDLEWIEFVKEFADFSKGPVSCVSGGDYYEDEGPRDWYIGTHKAILDKEIDALTVQIGELIKERESLQKQLKKADDKKIVNSLNEDEDNARHPGLDTTGKTEPDLE